MARCGARADPYSYRRPSEGLDAGRADHHYLFGIGQHHRRRHRRCRCRMPRPGKHSPSHRIARRALFKFKCAGRDTALPARHMGRLLLARCATSGERLAPSTLAESHEWAGACRASARRSRRGVCPRVKLPWRSRRKIPYISHHHHHSSSTSKHSNSRTTHQARPTKTPSVPVQASTAQCSSGLLPPHGTSQLRPACLDEVQCSAVQQARPGPVQKNQAPSMAGRTSHAWWG